MGEAAGGEADGTIGLTPLAFADLPGWNEDDHAAAFAAFRRGADVLAEHPPKARALAHDVVALVAALEAAQRLPLLSRREARDFFEDHFRPFAITGGFF